MSLIDKANAVKELLTRGVVNLIPGLTEFESVLMSSKKLNVYLGIDPTATRIHLGHAVNLRKLQAFIELGHRVIFLVGDFTARVGDNSDKESGERPILTKEEIENNFHTYKQQAEKILDFSRAELRYNSEWLAPLTFAEVLKLCQQFSLNDYLSREIMKKKLETGVSIRLDEVLYPIMQGYDSYFMDTDIQVGGADQTFNMQAGRALQKRLRSKESFVLVNDYLLGTDSRKMSKSWDNAIWLTDSSEEMFGKTMSLKDELIESYFVLGTNVPWQRVVEVKKRLKTNENPIILKKELALAIVSEFHGEKAAKTAQARFEKQYQERSLTGIEIPLVEIDSSLRNIIDILVLAKIAESKAAARSLIKDGAVQKMVQDKFVKCDRLSEVSDNEVLKSGRSLVRIHFKE